MCNNLRMATNLAIDDRLIEEARKTGGHKTKKEAVTTALEEYIRHHGSTEFWRPLALWISIRPMTQGGASQKAHGMTLGDTPIWSLALRRRAVDLSAAERRVSRALYELVLQNQVQLLGSTRQEVLSGIREESQFRRIRDYLRDFPSVDLNSLDYEEAARMSNDCRRAGIAGSPVDMLMCAVSVHHGWKVFTTDQDFAHYRRVVSVALFKPQ